MNIIDNKRIISSLERNCDGEFSIQHGSKDNVRDISYYPTIGKITSSLRGHVKNIELPFDIEDGEHILIRTKEKFRLSGKQIGICFSRVQNTCEGLSMDSTFIDPGYEGHLHLSLRNVSNGRIRIDQEVKPLAKIVFFEFDGLNVNANKGQGETINMITQRIEEKIYLRIEENEKKNKNKKIAYAITFLAMMLLLISAMVYVARSDDGNPLQTGILQALSTLIASIIATTTAILISKNKKG
jgi:deoxycytidine triphosphate deaminase